MASLQGCYPSHWKIPFYLIRLVFGNEGVLVRQSLKVLSKQTQRSLIWSLKWQFRADRPKSPQMTSNASYEEILAQKTAGKLDPWKTERR